ncbi:MAG: hypothetical protein K2X01_06655 [Cyanobacteria bacterium]|nr:hypothetical protein [Cyanobacteriota bacterium]
MSCYNSLPQFSGIYRFTSFQEGKAGRAPHGHVSQRGLSAPQAGPNPAISFHDALDRQGTTAVRFTSPEGPYTDIVLTGQDARTYLAAGEHANLSRVRHQAGAIVQQLGPDLLSDLGGEHIPSPAPNPEAHWVSVEKDAEGKPPVRIISAAQLDRVMRQLNLLA